MKRVQLDYLISQQSSIQNRDTALECEFAQLKGYLINKGGFEVLISVSTKMAVFWVVAPCSPVEFQGRFRG
jgi:hypothetical protein